MRAHGVVKSLDIGENIRFGGAAGIIAMQMNQFAFETAEEVLRHGVVVGVSFVGHTLPDPRAVTRSRKAPAAYWTPLSL